MKHFLVLLVLVVLTFSLQARSQTENDLKLFDDLEAIENPMAAPVREKTRTRERAEKMSVQAGDQELKLALVDAEAGVTLGTYSTAQDTTKASVGFLIHGNLKDAGSLSTYDFTFSHKWNKAWLEGYIGKTAANTRRISNYNRNIDSPSEEDAEELSDLLQIGGGLMYRTTYIQNLLPSKAFFETISGMLTYNQYEDFITGESFSGPGIKADFGVHRRLSQRFHVGGKMSYNLASVKREAVEEGEGSTSRALLLRWISFGIDLSLYF